MFKRIAASLIVTASFVTIAAPTFAQEVPDMGVPVEIVNGPNVVLWLDEPGCGFYSNELPVPIDGGPYDYAMELANEMDADGKMPERATQDCSFIMKATVGWKSTDEKKPSKEGSAWFNHRLSAIFGAVQRHVCHYGYEKSFTILSPLDADGRMTVRTSCELNSYNLGSLDPNGRYVFRTAKQYNSWFVDALVGINPAPGEVSK